MPKNYTLQMTQSWEAKPRVLLDAMGVFHWLTLNKNTYMKFFNVYLWEREWWSARERESDGEREREQAWTTDGQKAKQLKKGCIYMQRNQPPCQY